MPPNFAKDITRTSIPQRRIIKAGDNGCAYWWIEFGGELDTVHDNERIRDELWSVIHGIWDHIKNSGEFDAANMTLEWVGSIPGKREYRRFLGDYVLHQGDILGQTEFADRVAFGGWSIDLHPPQGVYATEAGAKQLYADGIYHIPYRSLYSVNTENLLFAGRNISASHVAFGSTRVMATCATIGQAALHGGGPLRRRGRHPARASRTHAAPGAAARGRLTHRTRLDGPGGPGAEGDGHGVVHLAQPGGRGLRRALAARGGRRTGPSRRP